jgi:hypothetical protein
MKYRKFGRLAWQGSALGFGCMRLPTTGEDNHINEVEALRNLHHAIDHGVNYIDTAYPYHDGNSEVIVGKALSQGYRSKIKIATKMPTWLIETPADFDRYLNISLNRLQVEHIDFYLIHALFRERWAHVRDLGVLEWGKHALSDGRIGSFGFSFHGSFEEFKEIIDAYDWDMCQIQYNYMNETVQAGTKGLEYAASKGIAVVIMEPLLGGSLASPPDPIKQICDQASMHPVDMALRWLWNKPEVAVVLSGMGTIEQVVQNIEFANTSGVNTLTKDEIDYIVRVRDLYQSYASIPCTKCRYCMPCPNGVDIPRNFELYNEGKIYNSWGLSKAIYSQLLETQRAGSCLACRVCEGECPQHIEISDWMPRVHQALS